MTELTSIWLKDHSDKERGNPLLPFHKIRFSISFNDSFICTLTFVDITTFVSCDHDLEREIAQVVYQEASIWPNIVIWNGKKEAERAHRHRSTPKSTVYHGSCFVCWMERNVFNDALNTFYLRLYGVGLMVKAHSDSERGNPLPPLHGLFLISSNECFMCTIT